MLNTLIICKEEDFAELNQICAHEKGADEITIFFNSWEALIHITEEPHVDGIIIDVDINACDELRLVKVIQSLNSNIELVFTSESERYALEGFQYNIVNYFKKPYTESKIVGSFIKIRERKILHKKKEIYIKMFGGFELFIDGKAVRWNNSKAKELFCMLVDARGVAVSSEKIQHTLWPNSDSKRAAASFHTALHQLRRFIGESNIEEILECGRGRQCVNIEHFRCDIYEFERYLQASTKKSYAKAFELYKGHYLENENFTWKYFNRIRLEMQFEELLNKI